MHIHDFPTELLEEIFLHSVSQPHRRDHLVPPPFTLCPHSPATLSLISTTCKQWRDIALNFASLWTHIHVVDPQKVDFVPHVKLWMGRARSLPLCLSLRESESYNSAASRAIVTIFLNSLDRCQSFELIFQSTVEDFHFGDIERVPSGSLESVKVWRGHEQSHKWQDQELLAGLLLNTSSLRTIRWFCRLPGQLDPMFRSWENLQELSVDDIRNDNGFVHALSHCENLRSLQIRLPYCISPSTFMFSLPRLTRLSIQFGESSRGFLDSVSLPSLADLELVLRYPSAWDPLLDLIQRSDVTLTRLSNSLRVTGALGALTQLHSLEFYDSRTSRS